MAIQGKIMAAGEDYIVVAEKRIAVVDTMIGGKRIKTTITDRNDNTYEKGELKIGTIVFAKCYVNDALQRDGFVASQIHIIPHILGADDRKSFNRFISPDSDRAE